MAVAQFGTNIGEVNINLQGSNTQKAKAANILRDQTGMEGASQVFTQGVSAAAQLKGQANAEEARAEASKNVVEANNAKKDYNNMMLSGEYIAMDATAKAEAFEAIFSGLGDQSESYQNTFKHLAERPYTRAFEGREEKVKNSRLNVAPVAYIAWDDTVIGTKEGGEGRVGDLVTNRSAGKTVNDFAKGYAEQFNLDIASVRNSLMSGRVAEGQSMYLQAESMEDLIKTDKDVEELLAPLQNPQFFSSKENKTAGYVKELKRGLGTTRSAMVARFKEEAVTSIELSRNTSSPNVLERYTTKPNGAVYSTAYEGTAIQKITVDLDKFEAHETARQKAFVFNTTTMSDWSSENKETKEAYQAIVDRKIKAKIFSGNINEAAETIVSQGTVDATRLSGTRETISSLLGGKEGSKMYSTLTRLAVESPSALNVLYPDPKERAKLIALGPLNIARGEDFSETYKYIQGAPSIPPEKLVGGDKFELSKLIHKTDMPTRLKQELSTMYNTMAGYAVPHETIMKSLDKYIDTNPYELNLNSYTPNEQESMKWNLDTFKVNEDDIMYEDPDTGVIYSQDVEGNKVQMIDKKGLYDYSNRMTNIKDFNKAHWKTKLLEDTFDGFSTVVGTYAKVQLGRTETALTYADYLFNTKIDVTGSVVEREPFMLPGEVAPTILPKDEEPAEVKIYREIDNITSVITDKYGTTPEQTLRTVRDVIDAVGKLYPEQGDPVSTTSKIFTKSSFPFTSKSLPLESKLEQEVQDKRMIQAQESVQKKIEEHIKRKKEK